MLKRNPVYMKRDFVGVSYLLPFGQSIVDYEKNVRLNETGAHIWDLLEVAREKEALLQEIVEEYDCDEEMAKEIRKDMEGFLAVLEGQGVIFDTETTVLFPKAVKKNFIIADQVVRIAAEEKYIAKEFLAFAAGEEKAGEPDLEVRLRIQENRFQEEGRLLVRNKELMVLEQEDRYLILFHAAVNITEAFLSKDGKQAEVFFELYEDSVMAEELFHAIRFFFLYMVQKKGFFALHSVSLLYREKAWLFSGHSGMGKSTHTGFWQEALDTPVLNGDLNLLSIKDDEAVIYGIPWCGTSGISDTKRYPLGGIILLKKVDTELRCVAVPKEQKSLLVAQRFISPTWSDKMQEMNLDFSDELVEKIPVWKLDHIKDVSSVEPIKMEIDRYLNER